MDYKPGSILRIRMHNFLTYGDAEVKPGPRLNVVVGPNGSGKSTILCAIALGLGSNANALERGDGVGCFVMRDKEKGWVEIELKGRREGDPNIVIRRDLERASNRSSYKLDGEVATQALIHQKVQELGIQVNNLCTFLPQEKVGKFTEMDPQKLLMETEKVVCTEGFDLFTTHEELIRRQRALKTCDSQKETCEKELKKLLERREGLRGDKEKMEEKERLKTKADLLGKCYKWLLFRRDREKAIKLKADKEAKEKELAAAGLTVQPYTVRKKQFDDLVESSGVGVRNGQTEWNRARGRLDARSKRVELSGDEFRGLAAAVEEIEHKRAEKERERSKVQTELQKTLNLPPVNIEELKNEMARVLQSAREAKKIQDERQRVVGWLKQDLSEVNREIYETEQRREREERQENQRLNRLRTARHLGSGARTACEAHEWVQRNAGAFTGRVYGPLILEMSVEDEAVAAMVEQQCGNYTQLTFVVENKHDKDILMNEWKIRRNAKIVVQELQPRWREDLRQAHDNVKDMAHLAKDGISGIMLTAIKAPDQVLSALCTQVSIHRVLIGNDETEQQITQGLLERLCRRGGGGEGGGGGGGGGAAVAYTKRADGVVIQHRGRISRYGSNTFSTLSKLCRDAQLLGAGGRDEEEARELARREAGNFIAVNREKAANLQAEIRDVEEEQNTAGREATKLRKEQEKMQIQLREATGAQSTVRRLKKKLAEIEADLEKGVSDRRAELEKGTRAAARAYVDTLANQTEEVAEFARRWEENVGERMTQAMVKPLSRGAGQELHEQGQKHAELKQEVELLNSQYRTLMDAMKKTKASLMREIPITGDTRDMQVVDLLGGELEGKTCEQCQDMYEEAMQRADSIYDNPEVVAQYKELVRQVAAREVELAQHTGTCNSGQRKVEELAKEWTDALRPLVAKLHVRFWEYMRQMGCEGEVTLAEEPDDYERWGLVLRVRFREGTTLQPLQAKVQSGGERSVSTILFLMGLQSTVASPFRAVDEINQGMDERNERLVFSRIVANSANVQYFLVTPKLLPGLTAMEMEHVTVLFIFNAPELLPFDKWNVKSFLEAARRKRAAAGDGGGGCSSKRGRLMGAGSARNQEVVEIDDD